MEHTIALNENKVFRALYARGKSAARRTMAVYIFKNRHKRDGGAVNRLGITVSSKLGGAVVRNRVRRRLKEAYRLSEGKIRPGADIVIVARGAALNAPFDGLQRDLLSALGELSRLRDMP